MVGGENDMSLARISRRQIARSVVLLCAAAFVLTGCGREAAGVRHTAAHFRAIAEKHVRRELAGRRLAVVDRCAHRRSWTKLFPDRPAPKPD